MGPLVLRKTAAPVSHFQLPASSRTIADEKKRHCVRCVPLQRDRNHCLRPASVLCFRIEPPAGPSGSRPKRLAASAVSPAGAVSCTRRKPISPFSACSLVGIKTSRQPRRVCIARSITLRARHACTTTPASVRSGKGLVRMVLANPAFVLTEQTGHCRGRAKPALSSR
jgi:hypothetical protein